MVKSKFTLNNQSDPIWLEFLSFFPSEIKCIIDAFGSHLDIDLQQRSVEFSQLFKAHNGLRPALLEKMPPMQISRVSNQNTEFSEENEPELIMNGDDESDVNSKIAPSDSVSWLLPNSAGKEKRSSIMVDFLFFFSECLTGSTWWQY